MEFSAAHRLYREELGDQENFDLFGPCSNPYGHGHNYVLEATFEGPLDPHTGMVIHFRELKGRLQELVVAPLDHRHLNLDVAFLRGILPTSENLVRCLWERIAQPAEGRPYRLHRLRLYSTARNWVDYHGPTVHESPLKETPNA